MQKGMILRSAVIYVFLMLALVFSGGMIYLVASVMALFIFLFMQHRQKTVTKLTRWANTNARKAQVLITVLQILLLFMGLYAGFNLNRAGYQLPGSVAYIFGSLIIISFCSVPFLRRKRTIVIPREVYKNRLLFAGIALSFFIMMVFTGNRMENKYPGAGITNLFNKVDNVFFPEENDIASAEESTMPNASTGMAAFAAFSVTKESISNGTGIAPDTKAELKAEKKAKKLERKKARQVKRLEKRMAMAAALSGGAILLIVLLGITTCAGICLIIGGFGGSAGLIPLGILVAAASIYGIVKIAQKNRSKRPIP